MRLIVACVSAVLVLVPLVSHAVPTGLNAMPTAEVLESGQSRISYETESGKLYAPAGSSIYGTQNGLFLGIEVGVDRVSDKGTVYNGKWRLKGEGLILPALAVGVQNITSGEKPQYYAVLTKSLTPAKIVQLHAGLLRDENTNETTGMYGANVDLGPVFVQADRTNDRTSVGAGFTYQNITAGAIAYDYENAPNETSLFVSYRYSGN